MTRLRFAELIIALILHQAERLRYAEGNTPRGVHAESLRIAREARLWVTTLTNPAGSHSIKTPVIQSG